MAKRRPTGVERRSCVIEQTLTERPAPWALGSARAQAMCLMMASPNSEHFTSVAPSIRRAKS
jgi:hypothetical protein